MIKTDPEWYVETQDPVYPDFWVFQQAFKKKKDAITFLSNCDAYLANKPTKGRYRVIKREAYI
jgi:hypothetical protein